MKNKINSGYFKFTNQSVIINWGVATQKNRTLPQISNLGLVFFGFFSVFFGFFGFSILANFDWFNGFLLIVLLY